MRHVEESPAILTAIAEDTGASAERVGSVVSALRLAIDGLFLDGYTIFVPPFSITYPGDPIASLFAERWDSANDAERSAWFAGDIEASAEWLGVTLVEYLLHPVASELHVLMALFEGLGIVDADSPEGVETASIVGAWFDTFAGERSYRLSTVGLERDLEAWLIHHTERLVQIGYDVRLRQQQFVLPDRRRPDLVFDLLEEDGSTGTLIVELKATGGYLGAVDQLVGYMDAFVSLGLANGVLRGLLVADGIPPDVLAYADEKGIDTATLTELGYRRDLASATTTNPLSTIADGEPETIVQTFIIYSVPSQGDRETPVMYLDADGIDGLPTAVRPYDPDDEQHTELASQLWESVLDHPEFNTVGHIAVSFGGLTYADGSTVHPEVITAEETEIIDTESSDAALPAYFLAWGESVYEARDSETAPDPEPFLRLTARSLSDPVNDVEPVGTPGWEYASAREHLADEVLTPGQLGVRFGTSCYLLPANAAAERERATLDERQNARKERNKENLARAGRRVKPRATNDPTPAAKGAAVTRIFTMFHGMDSDQTQPLATLRFGHEGLCEWVSDDAPFATFAPGHIYSLALDEIASGMSSCVFVPVDGDSRDPGTS